VRISDLAKLVVARGKVTVETKSIAQNGVFDSATLSSDQINDKRTLLALKVNGTDLSMDHGFPARVIGPALPGVHCTKWAATMAFKAT